MFVSALSGVMEPLLILKLIELKTSQKGKKKAIASCLGIGTLIIPA